MQKHSGKTRARTNVTRQPRGFRLGLETLEDRTQPGGMLPFNEFSLLGRELFDQDPLTGPPVEPATAQQGLRVELALPTLGTAAPLAAYSVSQGTVQALTRDQGSALVSPAPAADNLALQAAVQSVAATQAPSGKLAHVVTQLQTGTTFDMRSAPITSVRQLPARALDIRPAPRMGIGNDGTHISALTVYTSFLGNPGADSGNAIATDDLENAYVAGYTSVTGTRDIRVTSVSSDGTAVLGDYLGTDFDLGGDEEALGIAVNPASGDVWITGYAFNGADNDLFVAQIDVFNGVLVAAVVVDSGLGNDLGTSIRFSEGALYVTGAVANDAGGTDVYAGKFDAADLTALYSNSFQIDGNVINQGDAIDVTATGTGYVVGTINDGINHLFVARVNANDGSLEQAMVRTDESIGGGVALGNEGGDTRVYLTGNVFLSGPPARFNGIVQKLQDTGKGFTQNYVGFIANSIAEGPIDTTGTDIRVSGSGKAYVMTEWHWPLCCGLDYRDRDAHLYKLDTAGSAFEDQYHYGITNFEALGLDSGIGLALNGTIVTATGYAGTTPAPGGFPVTPGVFQPDHADNVFDIPDAFVSRIDLNVGG